MLMWKSTHEEIVAREKAANLKLAAELVSIDSVLGNRSAFDHLSTRAEKITHAIAEASKVPKLQAEVDRLTRLLNDAVVEDSDEVVKLETELEEVKKAIEITQETAPIVNSQRRAKRRDLEELFKAKERLETDLHKARSGRGETQKDVAASAVQPVS